MNLTRSNESELSSNTLSLNYNENKHCSNCNSNVSIASKGTPQDEIDTEKYKWSNSKKGTERVFFSEPGLASSAPEVAVATISQQDDINN